MIASLLLGGGFAFAAALQPGPLQAYLAAQSLAHGWRRALPGALAPLLSDGPIALVAILVLQRLPTSFQHGLQLTGGIFLVTLAVLAGRGLQSDADADGPTSAPPRTFLAAAFVNLLNPNPYLAWALVMGPAVLSAWRRSPIEGIALVGAFYTVLIGTLGAIVVAVDRSSRNLGDRSRRRLLVVSIAVLAALGVWLAAHAMWLWIGP